MHFPAYVARHRLVAPEAPTISGTVTIGGTLTISAGAGGTPTEYELYVDGGYWDTVYAPDDTFAIDAYLVGPALTVRAKNAAGTSPDSNTLQYSFTQPAVTLLAHYDADLGVSLSSGEVTAWADQSGNGHHLAQGTSARRPLSPGTGPNGHNAIDWRDVGGTGKSMLTSTLPTGASARTVFLVCNPGTKTNGYLYGQSPTGVAGVLYGHSSRKMFAGADACAVTNPGGWQVDAAVFNGASSKHSINGGTDATGNPGAGTMAQLCLGSYQGDAANTLYSIDGYIGKGLLYTGAMTDADRADVTAALKWWGAIS